MAAWKCGWCGLDGHKEPVDEGWQVPFSEKERRQKTLPIGSRIFTTMECSACQGRSVAMTVVGESSERPMRLSNAKHFWRENDPIQVAPPWIEGQDFNYVPEHIAKAASEAYKCHSIDAYMAAILMARTSIEAAAKDRGVTEGKLVQKINELARSGLIRETIKDAAHHVRMFGNDMAHGDIEAEVTKRDSEQVLRLLTFILQDLYEVGELLNEVGISLDARKSEGSV